MPVRVVVLSEACEPKAYCMGLKTSAEIIEDAYH